MRRKHCKMTGWAFALLILAGLALLTSCNVASTGAAGTGRLNVLATDSPSDDWKEFTVVLTSLKLRNLLTKEWTDNLLVIDPNNPTKLNLVDLSGVATLLGNVTIPAGNYDKLKIAINTDPTTMTLIDDSDNTIAPENIVIADPSGKGEVKVDLVPPVTVDANGVANVQVDFDLAHPMAIILQNGKVVVNLVLRHKAIPRNLFDLQFARTLGTVISTDATAKTFVVTPVAGSDVTFGVDDATTYIDVDANAAGDFAGLGTNLPKGVLVASNLKNDGTLYARQVWYGTLEKLPQFTPEGIVRRVGDNWIKVYNKNAAETTSHHYDYHWDYDLIYVNSETVWTFQGANIGQGTSFLHNIRRGFRVMVTLVDPNARPRVAKTIDIQSAHDEGVIRSVTTTGLTFSGDDYGHCWYTEHWASHQWTFSAVPEHRFKWWFYGEAVPAAPADDAALATVIQNFVDTVTEAKNANLRAFARVELYWTDGKWVAENVILAPEKLPDPAHITVGYTTASGSIVVGTFDWDNPTMPTVLTINLDSTSDLQTIVGSLLWNSTSRILTLKAPVAPADWESYLTPALLGVRVWVRPVKSTTDGTFSWTAYAVLGFQVITN